jgi:acetolactate synthase-1/2/3 large subunit
VLVLGARLDPDQVGFRYDLFAKNAKRVQVDIDTEEFRKYPRGFIQFIADDLKHYLSYPQAFDTHDGEWLSWCKQLNVRYPAMLPEHMQGDLNIYQLSDALCKASKPDDVLAIGSSGPSANIILQTWKVKEGSGHLCPCSWSYGHGCTRCNRGVSGKRQEADNLRDR